MKKAACDGGCAGTEQESKDGWHYYDDPQRREQDLSLRKWTFIEATWKDKLLTWPFRAGLAIWKEVSKWTT